MDKTTRRTFISQAAGVGSALGAAPWILNGGAEQATRQDSIVKSKYAQLDKILGQPLLKRALFKSPVIIETLELLKYENSYLCRVRSSDGAEGISVAHYDMALFHPIFNRKLRRFFLGKDARDLDLILERILFYGLNFRLEGMALGIPLATIEFAILDMLGHISGKSVGHLVGEIHHPEVPVYVATEFRHLALEEHFDKIQEAVAQYDTNALKIKVGYMHYGTTDIHYPGLPGKSEKLVPMVRAHYGDDMFLYADSNGYYDVEGAIKMGQLLEEYEYSYFEEPVRFDRFEDIKVVADALAIPIANGEQDHSFTNFRWLLAQDGIDIVQPDNYYFGGMIRSIKVARMAEAMGKTFIPHMSGGGLGFIYNSHIVSVCPNAGKHHEFKGFRTHVPFECPTAPLKISNGKMKVPAGPGFGVQIDPDFVKKHTVVGP
ncbi:MAG: mandelate racemase/muconate lactonizing enzyme family protein [Saprospiraceae bacterium]|nr:mandelate racemase/muconate lactonizing enzyme family protein [Saprospiraceae bacterium]